MHALLRSRADLALEILALRQQVAVLKRKHARPRLKAHDRLFWIALRRLWPGWKHVLVTVRAPRFTAVTGSPNGWLAAGDYLPWIGVNLKIGLVPLVIVLVTGWITLRLMRVTSAGSDGRSPS